jgi:glycosyl hydrolase family 16
LSRLLLALVVMLAVWLAGVSTPAAGALALETPPTATSTDELRHAHSRARGAPAPIAGRGYHVVFQDGFKSFRRRVWTRSIWYEPPAAAGDIFTRRGVLHLVSRRGRGYPNVSVTTLKSRSFRQGYFEARMRWTGGHGAWPAFWLFSMKHARGIDCPPLTSELDVFEGQGSEPRVYYGTIHRNTNELCGVPDDQNDNNWNPIKPNLTRAFHVYSALWTRTSVHWYLDGHEVIHWPVYGSTDQPMFMILDMWTGGWTFDPDSATPTLLQLKVDWVRVWHR